MNLLELNGDDRLIAEAISQKVKKNNIFLSFCAKTNLSFADKVVSWISNLRFFVPNRFGTIFQRETDKDKELILKIMSEADFGIVDYQSKVIDYGDGLYLRTAKAIHSISSPDAPDDQSLDWSEESQGTQYYVNIMYRAKKIIEKGGVMIVDELESSLHPFLVDHLISLFNDVNHNKKNAQLIFTSHDVTIPDRHSFSKDQVWITSKNPNTGCTTITPLSDYDLPDEYSFKDLYLGGFIGGLPMTRFS